MQRKRALNRPEAQPLRVIFILYTAQLIADWRLSSLFFGNIWKYINNFNILTSIYNRTFYAYRPFLFKNGT